MKKISSLTLLNNIKLPDRKYSDTNPDPMKAINDYDIEEMEEMFPEKFNKFKI